MRKKIVSIINNCVQCPWKRHGGRDGLPTYFCGCGGGIGITLDGLQTIPDECPLENAEPEMPEEYYMEPGC